jgi:hypothetical protein
MLSASGGLAGGPRYPQGNFAADAEPGFGGMLRVAWHIPRVEMFALWAEFGGTFYSHLSEEIEVEVDGRSLDVLKTIDHYNFSLHPGLQLGSMTRRGFFRPRLAVCPSVYFFNTETSYRVIGNEEDLLEDHNTQARFGWHGLLGADLWFRPRWAVSFDFIYDHVLELERVLQTDDGPQSVTETARATMVISSEWSCPWGRHRRPARPRRPPDFKSDGVRGDE